MSFYFAVNVAHAPGQTLQGTASMSEYPFPNKQWIAGNVVDGNTNQTADGGSCAIMDFSKNYRSVWMKVQLGKRFNIAYIKLFFRNELSKLNACFRKWVKPTSQKRYAKLGGCKKSYF